jgi:hypothetical protein
MVREVRVLFSDPMALEPGTGSPVVEGIFYVGITLFFGVITLMLARTAFMMSLLWIMPVARLLSFVPPIRRWIERKTSADVGASR